MTLKKIDTSFWKLDDAEWVQAREAYWPTLEVMLKAYKPKKKNISPIKDYYLRGKMPNWNGYKDWEDSSRHLDLFMFLWLHPSWDEGVLTELRDRYITSDLIVFEDVQKGFGEFLDSQIDIAAAPYRHMSQVIFPYIQGKGELLFKVMMGNPEITQYEIQGHPTIGKKGMFELPKEDLTVLCTMGSWLCIANMLPIHNDFLFQYDQPLEWWYQSVHAVDVFAQNERHQKIKPQIEKALWRIHHFDTEKEGDTCRTRFVTKMRKILDERPFIKDIKTMWEKVKAGEVQVEDPWER
ncbi:MAG: hypothetical protein IPM37_19840 [Hahellaceae bacterium]|jgi:hypothetical protein|nr:hypothetical protein [Hahellaceae bacterium]